MDRRRFRCSVAIPAALAFLLPFAAHDPASAQSPSCVFPRHSWRLGERINAAGVAAPGALCRFGYNLVYRAGERVELTEVRVIQRPRQGQLDYSSEGKAQFTYQVRQGAAGSDEFIMRFLIRRPSQTGGNAAAGEWFEIKYDVRIGQ
jgi:hypothetical protein